VLQKPLEIQVCSSVPQTRTLSVTHNGFYSSTTLHVYIQAFQYKSLKNKVNKNSVLDFCETSEMISSCIKLNL